VIRFLIYLNSSTSHTAPVLSVSRHQDSMRSINFLMYFVTAGASPLVPTTAVTWWHLWQRRSVYLISRHQHDHGRVKHYLLSHQEARLIRPNRASQRTKYFWSSKVLWRVYGSSNSKHKYKDRFNYFNSCSVKFPYWIIRGLFSSFPMVIQ